jgi:P27 family predicted phage terminase small subunit
MRGRKPTPSAIHILRGLPGRRKPSADEPQPDPVVDLQPPDWLDASAQAEWTRVAPMLQRLGVLTESDVGALVGYCSAWATWKEATQQIRKWGMVLKDKDGGIPVVSPYVKIAHDALMHMRAFLVEFGMTPSSRARIHAPKKGVLDTPASKWVGLK